MVTNNLSQKLKSVTKKAGAIARYNVTEEPLNTQLIFLCPILLLRSRLKDYILFYWRQDSPKLVSNFTYANLGTKLLVFSFFWKKMKPSPFPNAPLIARNTAGNYHTC